MSLDETFACLIALDIVVTVIGWFRDRREHRARMAEIRQQWEVPRG